MFLTQEEIETLTRRKQGKRQRDKLKELGIRHHVVDGKPVVTWEAVNGRGELARVVNPFRFDLVT